MKGYKVVVNYSVSVCSDVIPSLVWSIECLCCQDILHSLLLGPLLAPWNRHSSQPVPDLYSIKGLDYFFTQIHLILSFDISIETLIFLLTNAPNFMSMKPACFFNLRHELVSYINIIALNFLALTPVILDFFYQKNYIKGSYINIILHRKSI